MNNTIWGTPFPDDEDNYRAYEEQLHAETGSVALPDDAWGHEDDYAAYDEQLREEEARANDTAPFAEWDAEAADAEHAKLGNYPDCGDYPDYGDCYGDDDGGDGDDDGGGGGGALPLPAAISSTGKPNPRARETAARAARIIESGRLLHDQSGRWFAYVDVRMERKSHVLGAYHQAVFSTP